MTYRTLFFAALASALAATASADIPKPATVETWEALPESIFDAQDTVLDDFKWRARPLVVFADSPFDPAFIEQMELLAAEPEELIERDILLLVDTNPDAASDLRQRLRPRGFSMVLIGKDGGVKLRKPLPWDIRELSRVIDKMPMRQREMEAN